MGARGAKIGFIMFIFVRNLMAMLISVDNNDFRLVIPENSLLKLNTKLYDYENVSMVNSSNLCFPIVN